MQDKSEFSRREEEILKFWQENKIFEKSVKQAKGRPFFSFYDGPPFLSGKPHHGHILATTIKDTVVRYKTMKGFNVPRRVGWDCHGLPVENLIEKELGIKAKKDIEEKIGIEKFNKACKDSVFASKNIFEKTLARVGRWSDYLDAYMTLDNSYIESVWWVFKHLWERNLVYKDYRVTPYCPRCGTPLSNFEVNQGYKETKDPSIFVKFKLTSDVEKTYFLVWTTTPWTLTANVALAVNESIKYKVLSINGDNNKYIIASDRIAEVFKEKDYEAIKEIQGKDLLGIEYKPLFKFQVSSFKFQVVAGDFVSTEDGTGIVHIAPAFGADDMKVGKENNLATIITVDNEGKMITPGYKWNGLFVKNADKEIIKDLESRNILFKSEKITHAYPFCWRCDSPLLYYPLETWYIAVEKIKDELIQNNKKINWVPDHIKEGRFGKWLEGARDWAFSRNRYWGAPVPIWQCQKCGEYKVLGSAEEIGDINLHRPYIDEIVFNCKCKGKMKRVPEVFDCWFESGAMPYAQYHYPFENKKLVEETFPADFIAEGLDQTRGWFYTLHVLATALFNSPAFKNVVANGLILDSQGRKLSKKLRNYTEPEEIMEKFGADALRFYLLSSTAIGEDYLFDDKGVQESMRKITANLYNSVNFFKTYANSESRELKVESSNILDQWILARLQKAINDVSENMDKYDLTRSSRVFIDLLDDLSNWHIRRSRSRFQHNEDEKDYESAVSVLHYVLIEISKLIAPFMPFVSEKVYQELKGEKESVHLDEYPESRKLNVESGQILKEMKEIRNIVALSLEQRAKAGIRVRQPLQTLKIKNLKLKISEGLLNLIKDELNVKEIIYDKSIENEIEINSELTPELIQEGIMRELVRNIQDLRKKSGLKPQDKIEINVETSKEGEEIIKKFESEIKKFTNTQSIKFSANNGEEIKINEIIFKIEIKK
ncbi:MAG: isoleucine--tRNA ligase [Patescibacteria group bacterium]